LGVWAEIFGRFDAQTPAIENPDPLKITHGTWLWSYLINDSNVYLLYLDQELISYRYLSCPTSSKKKAHGSVVSNRIGMKLALLFLEQICLRINWRRRISDMTSTFRYQLWRPWWRAMMTW